MAFARNDGISTASAPTPEALTPLATIAEITDYFQENINFFSMPVLQPEEFEKMLSQDKNEKLKEMVTAVAKNFSFVCADSTNVKEFQARYNLAIELLVKNRPQTFKKLLENEFFLFYFIKQNQSDYNAIINTWFWNQELDGFINDISKKLHQQYGETHHAVCQETDGIIQKCRQEKSLDVLLARYFKASPKTFKLVLQLAIESIFESNISQTNFPKVFQTKLNDNVLKLSPEQKETEEKLKTWALEVQANKKTVVEKSVERWKNLTAEKLATPPKRALEQFSCFSSSNQKHSFEVKPAKKRSKTNLSPILPYLNNNDLALSPNEKIQVINKLQNTSWIQDILNLAIKELDNTGDKFSKILMPFINGVLSACKDAQCESSINSAFDTLKENQILKTVADKIAIHIPTQTNSTPVCK